MAAAIDANDPTPNQDLEKPNHMIIWLDKHIGLPKECIHLKKAFATNIDPRHETWTKLNDEDQNSKIVGCDEMIIEFNGVKFLLLPFINEDACVAAFERNQDKRIFFITSGSKGKTAIPRIIENYRHVFTNPTTNKPHASVYVFCLHIEYQLEWVEDYLEYVQMFNAESELLERMMRDIANYFIERSEQVLQDNDPKSAFQYLNWAKRVWHEYDKMQQQIKTGDHRPVQLSEGMKKIIDKQAQMDRDYPEVSSANEDTNDNADEHTNNDDNVNATHNIHENMHNCVEEDSTSDEENVGHEAS